MNDPTRLGLTILAAFFVLTLVLVVAGLVRLAGPGLTLKKRAEALQAHPVLRAGPMFEIYLARINERNEELAATLERLQLALSDLERGTRGLRSTAATIAGVIGSLRAGFRGLRTHRNGRR
jgi:hypothetical protein